MMPAASRYDLVVIGAGHNGLAAAALLARGGRKVLVLERRESAGGLAEGEEFHPGFRSAGVLQDTSGFRPDLVRALGLEAHGLRLRAALPAVLAVGTSGEALWLEGTPGAAPRELARHAPRDAARWDDFARFVARVRAGMRPLLDGVPPDLFGLAAERGAAGGIGALLPLLSAGRRWGRRDAVELARVAPQAVADWLGEWFRSDLLRSALAAPALEAVFGGPRSPGTATNLLLHLCAAGPGVEGGPAALAAVLERAARAAGAEIVTGAEVTRIRVADRRVAGVTLAGGESVAASAVAASCDPRVTFLDLVESRRLPRRLEWGIERVRARGCTAVVHLALSRPPAFAAAGGAPAERVRTAPGLDALERAFDAAKYGGIAEAPPIEAWLAGTAPAGAAVLTAHVRCVPFALREGWSDGARERLGDRVTAALERLAPGIAASIVARRVLTPADLAARFALPQGHLHHGEHALDQLVARPHFDCARYATPVGGLFLCGSGSHPGGGITCAPGALAASVIARAT